MTDENELVVSFNQALNAIKDLLQAQADAISSMLEAQVEILGLLDAEMDEMEEGEEWKA